MKLTVRVDACNAVHYDNRQQYVRLCFRIRGGYNKQKGAILRRWMEELTDLALEVKRDGD